ncbi:Transcriptional regulatory protein LiaR [compost metagenome]
MARASPARPCPHPIPVPSVLLTKREQEILTLVEQSMSNKRIALALNISVQTVKWNLKNIFIKLNVSSRYEAIIATRKINR